MIRNLEQFKSEYFNADTVVRRMSRSRGEMLRIVETGQLKHVYVVAYNGKGVGYYINQNQKDLLESSFNALLAGADRLPKKVQSARRAYVKGLKETASLKFNRPDNGRKMVCLSANQEDIKTLGASQKQREVKQTAASVHDVLSGLDPEFSQMLNAANVIGSSLTIKTDNATYQFTPNKSNADV